MTFADAGVVLVNMPYGPLARPSIGLGLLKGSLSRIGVSATTLHLSIRFAERIGAQLYDMLSTGPPWLLMGEWTFSRALFPEAHLQPERYLAEIVQPFLESSGVAAGHSATMQDKLRSIREEAPAFLDDCVDEILHHRPAIVGLTSVFQQHVPTLALARRLKERAPRLFIVLGGANCEQAMGAETIRRFPFVDAVASGEADLLFPKLVRRVLDGEPVADLPGILTRLGIGRHLAGRPYSQSMVTDMDALPFPDYDEFFEQFERSRLRSGTKLVVLFETSRGCWWGEKSHCTFCGLNGGGMKYRSKTAARALDEFEWLTTRYPDRPVGAVDNILDVAYFKDFIPALAARKERVSLFYEVKTNMKKEQVRMLRDSGMRFVQPGVESLSTPVLKLMRKGTTALRNIQFLKWCEEYGVKSEWNMLVGFPGEPPEEYLRMARLLPWLSHLRPPASDGVTPIVINRFSPHFNQPEEHGFGAVRPHAAYRHVYPFAEDSLRHLAYYFEHEYREPTDVAGYTAPLSRAIAAWHRAYPASALFWLDDGTRLAIFDGRPAALRPLTVLTELRRELYLGCDQVRPVGYLQSRIIEAWGRAATIDELAGLLAPLLDAGLLLNEGEMYLGLAVPLGDFFPGARALDAVARRLPESAATREVPALVERVRSLAPPATASELTQSP